MLVGLNEDGMVHEYTHLLLDEAVNSPLSRVPAWLNEGLAMYFESDTRRREATAAQAVRDGALLRLRAMNAIQGKPEMVRLFYAQSWSVVKYMIDSYGTERMTSLLDAIDSGLRIDEAVEQAYGVSLEELEGRWRRHVTEATTLAPRPDPGTIAVSSLIAGAVVLMLSVSAYRWYSHRARRLGHGDTRPVR